MKDFTKSFRLLHFLSSPFAQESTWVPAADIYRTTDGWIVKLDVAGVKAEDITITLNSTTLTISGYRKDWLPQEMGNCTHYSMEIAYTTFERSIEFPCEITDAKVDTVCKDGMLIIRLGCSIPGELL